MDHIHIIEGLEEGEREREKQAESMIKNNG